MSHDGVDFKRGVASDTMTVSDVAAFLNVSYETTKQLLQEGQLLGYRLSPRIVKIYRASVEQYLQEQQAAPPYDEKLQQRLRKERRKRRAGGN